MKKPQPLHLKNSQSPKILDSLEVTSRTPPMRKSQFNPSRNNLKPSWKNLNLPEKFLPPSPYLRKLLNHHWNNLELNLNPSQKISTLREKISTPTKKKIFNPLWKFLNPLEYFSSSLKFLNPTKKISTPPEKISIPPEKSQPLPEKSQPRQKKSQPLPKKSQFLPKTFNPPLPPKFFSTFTFLTHGNKCSLISARA